MRKLLLKTVLVLLPVLLFVHQRGFAQCTLTGPSSVSVPTGAGKCGAVVTYTAPAVPSGCNSTYKTDSTFAFTGTQQTFVVPAGVTSVTIQTWGAQGGGTGGVNTGGLGGYAAGTRAVQPGDVLSVYVGGQPSSKLPDIFYPGGFNGGGNSLGGYGGGGGASDVRTGGTSFSNRLIVAGGGGGSAFEAGGAGGGLTGTSGGSSYCSYIGGGIEVTCTYAGGGGTQTGGGAAAQNGGYDGSFGQGGDAQDNGYHDIAGGGGGYYGGGSGGKSGDGSGGGGGGSGYVGGVTDSSMQTGVNSGNGKVVISYNMPVTLSVVQTGGLSSGALFPVGTTINTFALVSSNNDTLSKCSSTVTVTDNEKPTLTCPSLPVQCYNTSGSYSIPALGASDNCGIQSTSYIITGATMRSGTGNDATGAFNPGVSTITWTVTDVHGNQATCQTAVTVNPQVLVSIPDVKVLSKGVDVNTVYVGYAPAATITLSAQASGGSGALTYKWSTGATTKSITVSPTANTLYTVTVTDASGCTATATKGEKVLDIRCGAKNDKVTVCHSNGSLCIDKSAVAGHLNQGDKLGACTTSSMNAITATQMSGPVEEASAAAGVYPNPNQGQFTVQLNNSQASKAQVLVLDAQGRVLQKSDVPLTAGLQTLRFRLTGKASGLYLVKVISETGVQTLKVSVQR